MMLSGLVGGLKINAMWRIGLEELSLFGIGEFAVSFTINFAVAGR